MCLSCLFVSLFVRSWFDFDVLQQLPLLQLEALVVVVEGEVVVELEPTARTWLLSTNACSK